MRSARQLSGLRKGSVRQAADPASGVSGQVRLGVCKYFRGPKTEFDRVRQLDPNP